MTNSQTTTCPECETEQSKTAPFCQNCGYRIRSPETMREPMMALNAGGDDRSENKPDRRSGGRPARDMVSMSDDAGGDPVPQSPPAETTSKGSDTVVEGMEAIRGSGAAPGAEPTAEQPADTAGSPDSGSRGMHGPSGAGGPTPMELHRSRIRWIAAATLFGCLATVAGLSWLHLHRQADADSPADVQAITTAIIDIEEGPFRRGLGGQAEAFILESCFLYHDNRDRHCHRDRLLESEVPQQTVKMPAYRIDAAPVINADYQTCVDAGECEPIDYDGCDVWTPQGLQPGVRVPEMLQRYDRPVVCVDRSRASDFCRARGGRLPTHNQWEKAARGDTNNIFPWGNRWQPDRANWGERDVMQTPVPGKLDGFAWTSPPGAFPEGKSPYGVWDMAGNVAEWIRGDETTLDGYVRGGSWVSSPVELRATGREQIDADARRTDVGFRCVYPADQQ